MQFARTLVLLACGLSAGCSPPHDEPGSLADEPMPPSLVPPPVPLNQNEPVLPDSTTFGDGRDLNSSARLPAAATTPRPEAPRRGRRPHQALQQQFSELLNTGRFEEARNVLREALREQPDNSQLLYLMAYAHFSEGKLHRAEPVLNHVLKLDSGHIDARKLLCAVLTADGRCTAAIELIDPVIAAADMDAEAYVLRAAAQLRCRNWPAAIEDADVALQLDPSSARALLVRCAARLREGDVSAARTDLQAAQRAGAPEDQLQLLESQLAEVESKPAP